MIPGPVRHDAEMVDAPHAKNPTRSAQLAAPNGRGTGSDVVVVIPALNEAASIGAVLSAIARELPAAQILVVDDRSEDDTAQHARRAGARVLPLVNRLGAWGATQAGIRMALRDGASTVVTMDADGQHRSEDIPSLLKPLTQDRADVVIGTCTSRGSSARRLAWRLLRASSGIHMADLTSGFRAYNRRATALLAGWPASLLDYQDIGVLTLLLSEGMRVVEVEVCMAERRDGHSRIFNNWPRVAWYMAHTLLLGFTKRQLRGAK